MKLRSMLVTFALLVAGCARREAPPLPGDSVGVDGSVALSPPNFPTVPEPPLGPIESKLFSPEIVMEHQSAIGISPAQKDAISKEVQRGQSEMLAMQWDLNADKEKLALVLAADKVDETRASAQAARVMADENRIKAAHLGMLVRIKNDLTPEQQAKLRELRDGRAASADASAPPR